MGTNAIASIGSYYQIDPVQFFSLQLEQLMTLLLYYLNWSNVYLLNGVG
jgi:hypothetical protein